MNSWSRECTMLDSWFDAKSKELDAAEKQFDRDLITGKKLHSEKVKRWKAVMARLLHL